MCIYYKMCIHMHIRGLLLIYCSLSGSLMSHSVPYAHLRNHIRVNLIRKRYYPEKSWRNGSNFSLQANFKSSAEEVKNSFINNISYLQLNKEF